MVALEMVKKPVEFPKLLLKHMKVQIIGFRSGGLVIPSWLTDVYANVTVQVLKKD